MPRILMLSGHLRAPALRSWALRSHNGARRWRGRRVGGLGGNGRWSGWSDGWEAAGERRDRTDEGRAAAVAAAGAGTRDGGWRSGQADGGEGGRRVAAGAGRWRRSRTTIARASERARGEAGRHGGRRARRRGDLCVLPNAQDCPPAPPSTSSTSFSLPEVIRGHGAHTCTRA
eukprot:3061497-Prymnesium_polylepis.1